MENHQARRREQRKGFSRSWSKHHRIPKSRAKDVGNYDVHHPNNIIIVPANHHEAFHRFAANLLANELAEVLNQWIDPRAEMVAVWRSNDDWKRSNGGILYR